MEANKADTRRASGWRRAGRRGADRLPWRGLVQRMGSEAPRVVSVGTRVFLTTGLHCQTCKSEPCIVHVEKNKDW